MAPDQPVSDPDPGKLPSPATGERDDHREAPPGVSIPGSQEKQPAPETDEARERGDE